MTTTSIQLNETPVVLTTGIYDLLKDHIRRKKLSKANEAALELQLKKANQVLRKDLPLDVVTVNTLVTVRDVVTGTETDFKFVSPDKARRKNGTVSILSPMGIAMIGYAEGALVEWEFEGSLKTNEIVKVSRAI